MEAERLSRFSLLQRQIGLSHTLWEWNGGTRWQYPKTPLDPCQALDRIAKFLPNENAELQWVC